MAIFRQGVKIGPFDIRAGITRDKSLQRIDYPKDYRRANTENTIGRFRASMGRAEGYARQARFAVRLFLPAKLQNLMMPEYDDEGGGELLGYIAPPDAPDMLKLRESMGRQMDIHCDSVSMPGHDLESESHTMYGPDREVVTGHAYKGSIAASFYGDKYLRERHFLEMWQKMAVDIGTHKANYYDEYTGKMHIYQLGGVQEAGGRDRPTYAIEAIEVYPETIAAVPYSYASSNTIVKINVEFQYRTWHNLITDRQVPNIEFGAGTQTHHPVLGGKPTGAFGGILRDVANQAATQVPSGKLFGGKISGPIWTVFKPFT
jgi:hypothetical protein